MTDWISLDEAVEARGVRLILARFGLPSPWSEFCRAIFDVKKIPYLCVDARDAAGSYRPLRALTAQESVPVVLIERERPRCNWLEQLYAAERLAPEPALLPEDTHSRALVIGMIAELCGERGFGWCRRLQMIEQLLDDQASARDKQTGAYLQQKYGGLPRGEPGPRCEAIVAEMASRLWYQYATDQTMFFGSQLTAADLAWAAFASLIVPLPDSMCPTVPRWRELFTWTPQCTSPEDVAPLLSHRDRIYRTFLTLPVPTQ
jgi:glutathione S-transferase